MQDVVIVSTARTPIGRAYRGAFDNLTAPTLGAIAIREALARSKVEPAEIEDVIFGATLTEGTTYSNVARRAALGLCQTNANQVEFVIPGFRWTAQNTCVFQQPLGD